MQRIRNLEDLLDFVTYNPGVAKELKKDPRKVAAMLGVELNDSEAELIAANLDIDAVLANAESADSMAAKVAQGVGLSRHQGE
ncbi:hypothetical protein ABT144_05830 [Streptomyces sp. NPDC002039]|uniref:hypothetical protein n=1 Tax=unclassified Streptomyces TaxID=2593676 RepID=UPI00333398B7